MISKLLRLIAALLTLVAFVARTPAAFAADSGNAAILEAIDLSPGVDASMPQFLAIHRATQRLFVGGVAAVKVIDLAKREPIAGISLDRYRASSTDFEIIDMAVDESSGPGGNKLYVLGRASETLTVVRIVDAQTNASLTAEGTDVVLPAPATGERYTMLVVNRANQKLYVATSNGRIVIVHGPDRTIVKTVDAGARGSLVVNPVANRVFVLGGGRSSIIDSNTDALTPLLVKVSQAHRPVFSEQDGRIYFCGAIDTRPGVFAMNGTTGQLVAEANLPGYTAIAVAPERQRVYVSEQGKQIAVLDATDLHLIGSIPHRAEEMAYGRAGGPLIIRHKHAFADRLRHGVGLLDLATNALHRITVAYFPAELALNGPAQRLYVADAGAAELIAIDSEEGRIIDRVDVQLPRNFLQTGGDTREVAVSNRFNRVFLSNNFPGSPGVEVFDGVTHQLLKTIKISSLLIPRVAVDDQAGQFYLTGHRSAESGEKREHLLYVFAGEDEPLGTVSLGLTKYLSPHGFHDLVVNPLTGRVYVFGANELFYIIDGYTRTVIATVNLGYVSGQLAIDTKANIIYIASYGLPPGGSEKRILAVDGETGAIIRSIAIPDVDGNVIYGIAVDELSSTLYVSHGDLRDPNKRITAYDGANNYRVKRDLHVTSFGSLLFDPQSRRLYVADSHAGAVTVLRVDDWRLLGNISTRGRVGAGDQVLIGGFIVAGPEGETKKVIVRAIGPSLSSAGVADALANPTLELHDSHGNVVRNDDWKIDAATQASQQSEIQATGIPPSSDAESALTATLAPGPYTVVVAGKDGSSGVALVEVYDLQETGAARLANISTRGFVGAGDEAMIGGVIVLGLQPTRILVRAIGPSLNGAGVADALGDPTLALYDSNGALVDSNDDWKSARAAEIEATTIPPAHDRESAVLATLYPGNYTAVVQGKASTTGVALVEAYRLD